jgi:hypothetical protein
LVGLRWPPWQRGGLSHDVHHPQAFITRLCVVGLTWCVCLSGWLAVAEAVANIRAWEFWGRLDGMQSDLGRGAEEFVMKVPGLPPMECHASCLAARVIL